jgi:thiol-disulfide isomerase/thioredoxin
VVRFADPNGASARLFPLFRADTEQEERSSRAYQAFVAAGGDRDSFRWDVSGYRKSLAGRIPTEHDPLRRQYLLLSFFRKGGSKSDSLLALRALDEIPPESALWGLAPGGPSGAMWSLWRATGPSRIQAYAEKGSEANPDRDVRAGFLSVAMAVAKDAGDKDRLGRYTTRMTSEFQGTFYEEIVRKEMAPNRKIRVGQPAPDVAFTGLQDTSQVIRVSDFRGRHLLIDFWAVWCGPCRGEMPNLMQAWETFGDRGLAVLSVSFDLQRADVAAYRRDKWSMPWQHAFADGGFGSKESAAFDVSGIPKPVLVGPDGVIEAEGEELRGEKLSQVLARVLGEPAGGTQHK